MRVFTLLFRRSYQFLTLGLVSEVQIDLQRRRQGFADLLAAGILSSNDQASDPLHKFRELLLSGDNGESCRRLLTIVDLSARYRSQRREKLLLHNSVALYATTLECRHEQISGPGLVLVDSSIQPANQAVNRNLEYSTDAQQG